MLQFCILNERPQYFGLFRRQLGALSCTVKRDQRLTPLMVAALSGKVQYLHLFGPEADIMDPNNRETVVVKVRKLIEANMGRPPRQQREGLLCKMSYCRDNAMLAKILEVLDRTGVGHG